MNRFNPEKLLSSKWTARQPREREKHFVVTSVLRDEQDRPTGCILEAVLSRREYQLDWRELRDDGHWLQGWC